MNRVLLSLAALFTFGTVAIAPIAAQITAVPNSMNFQGRLATPNGNPVPNGTYSIRFSLWDTLTGGTEKWNKIVANVNVKNGTFAVTLDAFPAGTFNGNRWLEIKIGSDTALTPRQPIVTVPYAFKAGSVSDSAITGASIANGTLTATNFPANFFNSTAWLLSGNSGINPATQFLGTTDNQSLNLRVNNRRAVRYQYAENTATAGSEFRSINTLGGSEVNTIAAGVVGGTIAGGGKNGFNGTNAINDLRGDFGFIGGGLNNLLFDVGGVVAGGSNNIGQGNYSFLGGGTGNNTQGTTSVIAGGSSNYASGTYSTIGGGDFNQAVGDHATVTGGGNNVSGFFGTVGGGGLNTATGDVSTVGGGDTNTASEKYATVAGGYSNIASERAATIAGGYDNTASERYATVGGGNTNTASGLYATVIGGYSNIASGIASMAAGSHASALHNGSFVWGDNSTSAEVISSAPNQFIIRAAGGLVLESNANPALYTSNGSGETNRSLNLFSNPRFPSPSGLKAGGILCADNYGYSNPGRNDLTVKGRAAVGFDVNITAHTFAVNGGIYCIGLTNASDVRYKTHIAPLPHALDTLLNLRGVSFDWKPTTGMEFPDGRQIGFIAQEVEKILPELVSTDKNGYKSVAYANVVPVLVEAMKAQQAQINRLSNAEKRATDAEKRNAELESRLSRLEKWVEEMATAKASPK